MAAKSSLQHAIKSIIEKEHLKNAKVEYEEVIESGYVCNVKVVNIKHDESELSLFLKRLPQEASPGLKLVYLNEINFYKNISEFKKLDADVFSLFPKCYYLDNEVIILENLRVSGLTLWSDLKTPLDESHVMAVMEQYGRFHALSAALKFRSPDVYNEIFEKKDVLKRILETYTSDHLIESMGKKAAAAFNTNEQNKIEAFLKFVEVDLEDFLSKMYADEEYDVICHGDCWPHNFMFKYEESQISGVCLIDFQLSFRASPFVDISYFMCTSGCSREHFERMQEYLKIYHHSFSKQMGKLGFDAERIITFETLMDQWKKYGKYGLIWGMIINKMLIADKDEIEDNRQPQLLKSFNFISRNENLYHKRMRDSINYFYEGDML